MSWVAAVRARIRLLLSRADAEERLSEEFRFHLEMQTAQNIRKGMEPHEARRQALIAFGGLEGHKETMRDERGLRWLEDFLQDLRYGLRRLRRRPGFTAVTIATLAIGIGSTTTVFSLTNAVLFRPVPGIAEQDRLAQLRFRAPHLEDEETGLSALNLRDLQAIEVPAITHVVGWSSTRLQVAVPGGTTGLIEGAGVAGDYFGALGVIPAEGRLFGAAETSSEGGPAVVVISERAKQTLFGLETPAVGRPLLINGVQFTVVGVAADGFRGVLRGGDADIWYPYSLHRSVRHLPPDYQPSRGSGGFGEMFVRLARGADRVTAESQLRDATARLVAAHPEENERYADYLPTLFSGFGLDPWAVDGMHAIAALLLGAVSLVLLISCANVANLLIFHGLRRRGESAVRQAIGASSLRLTRQHLTESCLLALGGTGVGLLAAGYLARLFVGLELPSLPPLDDVPMDWRVAGFAAVAGCAAVLLAGLVPAIVVHRVDLSRSLKDASRTETGRRVSLRGGLTILQIALSLTLLVSTLLLGRTLHSLLGVDLGYDASGVVEAMLSPDPQGYSEEEANAFQRELLTQAALIPGAEAASAAVYGPLNVSFVVDLRPAADLANEWPVEARQDLVSPDYFRTLGVPLRAGRTFSWDELESSWQQQSVAAVVNETLAVRLFGSVEAAVGRDLLQRGYQENTPLTIVGVAQDFRSTQVTEPVSPTIFRPLGEHFSNEFTLFVRSPADTEGAVQSLRAAVDRVDPTLPFYRSAPLEERIQDLTREPRFLATLMSVLAAVATFLSGIGLYGVVAYSVAERTREIGVRIALGARGAEVITLVLRQSLGLAAAGLAVGSLSAWAMARLLQSRLFGVEPLDPAAWLSAFGFFILVSLLSAAVPARSASSVDPVSALKA